MSGEVILLNGCSSSGKTTLAQALQQMLPTYFQHIALDQFRDGLPARTRGLNAPAGSDGVRGLNVVPDLSQAQPHTHIVFGDHGQAVLAGMRRTVHLFANHGLNVIADDLLFEAQWLRDYAALLDPEHCWVIGVFCDPLEIERREAARIGRFPGTARAHSEQVHSHGFAYDLEVNSTQQSAYELAQQVIARLQTPPQMLSQVRSAAT